MFGWKDFFFFFFPQKHKVFIHVSGAKPGKKNNVLDLIDTTENQRREIYENKVNLYFVNNTSTSMVV